MTCLFKLSHQFSFFIELLFIFVVGGGLDVVEVVEVEVVGPALGMGRPRCEEQGDE